MSSQLGILAFCLFLGGLGLLLFVFLRIILRSNKRYSRKSWSLRKTLLLNAGISIGGILLILAGQNLLWLNSNLRMYYPLKANSPLASVSFTEREYEKPRMIIQTYDESNNPLIASEILLSDSLFQIEMQVIKFKRLGNLMGLDEIYRFTQVTYISNNPENMGEIYTTPLVDLERPVIDYINNINKFMSVATHKTIFTDPLVLDSSQVIEITYTDLGTLQLTPADSSRMADSE